MPFTVYLKQVENGFVAMGKGLYGGTAFVLKQSGRLIYGIYNAGCYVATEARDGLTASVKGNWELVTDPKSALNAMAMCLTHPRLVLHGFKKEITEHPLRFGFQMLGNYGIGYGSSMVLNYTAKGMTIIFEVPQIAQSCHGVKLCQPGSYLNSSAVGAIDGFGTFSCNSSIILFPPMQPGSYTHVAQASEQFFAMLKYLSCLEEQGRLTDAPGLLSSTSKVLAGLVEAGSTINDVADALAGPSNPSKEVRAVFTRQLSRRLSDVGKSLASIHAKLGRQKLRDRLQPIVEQQKQEAQDAESGDEDRPQSGPG